MPRTTDILYIELDDPRVIETLEREARQQHTRPDTIAQIALQHCTDLELFRNITDPLKSTDPDEWIRR
jgi:hypothetical protein